MIKKFGIIGNPIKHSLSPVLHNYWFKKYNINANKITKRSSSQNYNNRFTQKSNEYKKHFHKHCVQLI